MYFLLRTFATRIGRTDLSLLAADRGIAAAQDSGDPIRLAAAHWNLGHILLAQDEAEAAETTDQPDPLPAEQLRVSVIGSPPAALSGGAVEFEVRVPPSGELTLVLGKQRIAVNQDLAGARAFRRVRRSQSRT